MLTEAMNSNGGKDVVKPISVVINRVVDADSIAQMINTATSTPTSTSTSTSTPTSAAAKPVPTRPRFRLDSLDDDWSNGGGGGGGGGGSGGGGGGSWSRGSPMRNGFIRSCLSVEIEGGHLSQQQQHQQRKALGSPVTKVKLLHGTLRPSSSASHLPSLLSNSIKRKRECADLRNGENDSDNGSSLGGSLEALAAGVSCPSSARHDPFAIGGVATPASAAACHLSRAHSSSPKNYLRKSASFVPFLDRRERLSWNDEQLFLGCDDRTLSPDSKHVHTEQLLAKPSLKPRLTKMQTILNKAFAMIDLDDETSVIEGLRIIDKMIGNAWMDSKLGYDLGNGLCEYVSHVGFFDTLLSLIVNAEDAQLRVLACRVLSKTLTAPNRDYLLSHGLFEKVIRSALSLTGREAVLTTVRLLEGLFKQSARCNKRLLDLNALEYILKWSKTGACDEEILRHASVALTNLIVYSDQECQQKMLTENVPEWLFLLASSRDDVTRYYACLSICALVANKETESAVVKSGTLALVEPFLLTHEPSDFIISGGFRHYGRSKEFLQKLVLMLNGKRRECRTIAAFHFAMDAEIKRKQDRLEVLREIGAVEALKTVAELPEEAAPRFASQALQIIGEQLPRKLSPQVPLWTVDDVQHWICKIGFEEYAQAFGEHRVDGDLLLRITNQELEQDLGMKSGLLQKRFMRELQSLKMAADYSCVDETRLDRFLVSINSRFSIYTYKLLEYGISCDTFSWLNDDFLKNQCQVENAVHRMKLCRLAEECKLNGDMELELLSKRIDIFISYRRSTGGQLASLLKVLLQLRGYKVFIDVDRLCAGEFDSSLLRNIQAAKHFVLILTPHTLDRCIGDTDCGDWVHKEILRAIQHNKNIIPVFDPQFNWPDEELPLDIQVLTRFNGVQWVHEYQEACVDKLEKFIQSDINRKLYQAPNSWQLSNRSFIGNLDAHYWANSTFLVDYVPDSTEGVCVNSPETNVTRYRRIITELFDDLVTFCKKRIVNFQLKSDD